MPLPVCILALPKAPVSRAACLRERFGRDAGGCERVSPEEVGEAMGLPAGEGDTT